MSIKTRKPLGILSGVNFNRKKKQRTPPTLLALPPLTPKGEIDPTVRCGFNSPYNPYNRVKKSSDLALRLVEKFFWLQANG